MVWYPCHNGAIETIHITGTGNNDGDTNVHVMGLVNWDHWVAITPTITPAIQSAHVDGEVASSLGEGGKKGKASKRKADPKMASPPLTRSKAQRRK